MELYQIRHFVAVVEAGGFTKAAQRVAVSQPAISASIAKLEAELNVKLLERRHGQVVPTAEGKRFLETGKAILRSCNAVKSELKMTPCGCLKIGVMQPLSSEYVSKLLNSFQRANPNIPIEVADGHCDEWCHCEQLFGPVADGSRDAVLSIFNDRIASKFAGRVLFKTPYMLAVREDHRFARRQAVSLSELDDEPFILPKRCIFLQDVTNALASRGVRVRVVYRTDRDDRALALVAAGLGLALVPGYFVVPAVKQVPVTDLGISREVGLLWPRERKSPALREFIAFAERPS
jgi:DNA-binding transcriptional LysR family regulator